MQISKGIALGLLFSLLGSIGYLLVSILIGILRGGVTRNHATGLGALVIGLKNATLLIRFTGL